MCAYKLVTCEFKWWGLQSRVEKLIVNVSNLSLVLFILAVGFLRVGGDRMAVKEITEYCLFGTRTQSVNHSVLCILSVIQYVALQHWQWIREIRQYNKISYFHRAHYSSVRDDLSSLSVLFLFLKAERRIFTNFHRQVFCWTDSWFGMTMEDIRALEDKTKKDLDEVGVFLLVYHTRGVKLYRGWKTVKNSDVFFGRISLLSTSFHYVTDHASYSIKPLDQTVSKNVCDADIAGNINLFTSYLEFSTLEYLFHFKNRYVCYI